MDGVLPSPPPPTHLTCPSALAAATASNTSSPSGCPMESQPPHCSTIRRTTPLTRRTASLRHLFSELPDSTMTTTTATSTAFTRWIDQGHLHQSLIQELNLWRSGMRDFKASSTTKDSPTSSLQPFRLPAPDLTQPSTMLTSNSSQQQQQQQQMKKKKKKRRKKPPPSDLQPAKPLPSTPRPVRVPSPMATPQPIVLWTQWTSPLRWLPPVRQIASPAVPLRLPRPHL